ncbi:Crp/Fnr family transcriptional regulator [Epilithonimonas sp. JDS]|uniref:Crp/Fnr family transcriptional regulator n=1 Tax=Epilithonimonas sp. JDS TaxID=2902797 RepID=UPI001E53D2AE|nr:Crp/Fnr family transcriptional regulator [Epilithonimonas sp. JDS]MCD9855474.1 Crp/Fnr family transcriptional regulator [Epilithonimonas sp. JDS]
MLAEFADFSDAEIQLFNKNICKMKLDKNAVLSKEGTVSKSIFFIVKGSFYKHYHDEKRDEQIIIDLFMENEWVFDHESLISQLPATSTIKAFEHSEVLELTLNSLHHLIKESQKFLQFNKLLSTKTKMSFFDRNINPAEKYNHLLKTKPRLIQTFPLTMIASYLKIRPETLSRVRANVSF